MYQQTSKSNKRTRQTNLTLLREHYSLNPEPQTLSYSLNPEPSLASDLTWILRGAEAQSTRLVSSGIGRRFSGSTRNFMFVLAVVCNYPRMRDSDPKSEIKVVRHPNVRSILSPLRPAKLESKLYGITTHTRSHALGDPS